MAEIAAINIHSHEISTSNYESANNRINLNLKNGIDPTTQPNTNAFKLYVNSAHRPDLIDTVTATGNQLQLQLNTATPAPLTESDVIEVRYQRDLGPLNNSQGQPIDAFSAVLNTTNTLTAPGIGATAGAVNVYLKDTQTLRSGQSVFVSYNAPIGTGPPGRCRQPRQKIHPNRQQVADNSGPQLTAGTQGIELLADGAQIQRGN